MKKQLLVLCLLVAVAAFGQASVNDYEYVIVPTKLEFAKGKDPYGLSTFTKNYLQSFGLKAYLDTDNIPEEIDNQRCAKLYADVDSFGSFLVTKMKVILKDCKGNVLYTSDEGKTKEKDWEKSYKIALRQALLSMRTMDYKYVPVKSAAMIQNAQPAMTTVLVNETFENAAETLFAQPIKNGYQLVDATPKIVMKIFKTADSNRFSAVKGDLHGDLISRKGQWFFEYYQNDQLVSEKMAIKF